MPLQCGGGSSLFLSDPYGGIGARSQLVFELNFIDFQKGYKQCGHQGTQYHPGGTKQHQASCQREDNEEQMHSLGLSFNDEWTN